MSHFEHDLFVAYLLYLFALIPFYLIGALPTGRIIALRSGVQIEGHGSGNVGATNVARVVGKKAGLVTLVADVCKGAAAYLLARLITESSDFSALAGLSAVAGHCFSIPGYLRGGKGVATALGVNLLISPLAAGFGLGLFALVFAGTRIVSLSSVTAALAIPIIAIFLDLSPFALFGLGAISLIVTLRHKENLVRISEGREKKFGFAESNSNKDGHRANMQDSI